MGICCWIFGFVYLRVTLKNFGPQRNVISMFHLYKNICLLKDVPLYHGSHFLIKKKMYIINRGYLENGLWRSSRTRLAAFKVPLACPRPKYSSVTPSQAVWMMSATRAAAAAVRVYSYIHEGDKRRKESSLPAMRMNEVETAWTWVIFSIIIRWKWTPPPLFPPPLVSWRIRWKGYIKQKFSFSNVEIKICADQPAIGKKYIPCLKVF
jgi:hypothetical protein